MTLQQMEYIVAVDTYRHFSTAAEKCFVTQPSLSTMIQKLEEELGVKIFDRSKQPVVPTEVGAAIVAQARQVLKAAEMVRQIVQEHQETLTGELRLGIIPTLAPYLLPLFLKAFSREYTHVKLLISEITTENILALLKKDLLDVGIMATPTQEKLLFEEPIFYEEFVVYAPKEDSVLEKRYLMAEEIDVNRLVMLEEGHCMRSQVVNLCALQKVHSVVSPFSYEVGSIETLRRLVESHEGITILPQLAIMDFDEDQMQYVRFFKSPAPVREVSLVTRRAFSKRRLIEALKTCILDNLPPFLREEKKRRRVLEI